ncbi:MAG: NUDIX domain-containing protein [Planctomycetota bacterium]|nr:NUDIX domain-containing protein [Planctomycetota bacterium]
MSAPLRIPLDPEGVHGLILVPSPEGGRIELFRPASSLRSPLHDAFRSQLALEMDGEPLELTGDPPCAAWRAGSRVLRAALGQRSGFEVLEVALGAEPRVLRGPYRLSPFESRYLAENGQPHPSPGLEALAPAGLATDLHVHFAGCLSGEDLLELGARHGAAYPSALLREAGMEAGGGGELPLAELPASPRARLAERLSIPCDRQITFLEMERLYRLRGPLTKRLTLFAPLLRRIAADYAKMGARYVELSLSNAIEAEWLREIHREAPAIEAESGVTIRFLAALSRHDDLEWDLDCIERIKRLKASRYLAGVDFMGHETNSTRTFERQLRELAEWAHEARPGFVLRVHAGENPAYPENVRACMEAVASQNVQLRIGHGLYGADEETLKRLVESRAVVEFNLNSNFALNNIQGAGEVPLRRYVERGVRVTLGTDGYGIYRSTLELEARAARLCGLEAKHLEALRATEREYLDERSKHEARHTAEPAAFDVPDDPAPHYYTPDVPARKKAEREAREAALRARLAELRVPLVSGPELETLLRGRFVVSFAGSWAHAWERTSEQEREAVCRLAEELFRAWDPRKTVIVAGGTRHGVEGVVQARARAAGFDCLGTLVWATPPESLEPGLLTHAAVVGRTLYDKGAGLYELIREFNGLCLFVGGGPIVNDEIQTAANLRLRYLLMDGPAGASTQHARRQPERAFRDAASVLAQLEDAPAFRSRPDPYWHLGPNPTADMVLVRANPATAAREVLLIRRDPDAPAEPGKWALPGGFVATDAPRGELWRPGVETASSACLRELLEETGLDIRALEAKLLRVGVYEGGGRDPRDTAAAWSRSTVFALNLPRERAGALVAGSDDANEARWFPLDSLPPRLAFDHARILADGLRALAQEPEGRG